MKTLEQFFLYCAGVDFRVLEQCPSDRNKYVGIGATIFFTGLLAFFSSGYALFTVFDSVWAAMAFGAVWGLMIFNLDRYIVMSMKSNGRWWRDLGVALPRVALAVLLAVVISKPLEMKVFEKEINAELVQMEQEVYKRQEERVQERFAAQIAEHRAQIDRWKSEIQLKTAQRDTLVRMAAQEADGTGGSGKKNLGPIYRAKKDNADQAEAELGALLALNVPQIQAREAAITALEATSLSEIKSLARSRYDGLAARMEALDRLAQQSRAIWLASLFITLLFIAIETAPIVVKLISYRSPYDYLLHDLEHAVEAEKTELVKLRANALRNRVRYDTETGTYLTAAQIAAEKALIDQKLKEKLDEMKTTPFGWTLGNFSG